ncbi:hypothetical protein [Salmonella enterica]
MFMYKVKVTYILPEGDSAMVETLGDRITTMIRKEVMEMMRDGGELSR